jgi:hypothetical protein
MLTLRNMEYLALILINKKRIKRAKLLFMDSMKEKTP